MLDVGSVSGVEPQGKLLSAAVLDVAQGCECRGLSHFSHVGFCGAPCTVARQAPLSMGILQRIIPEWVANALLQGIFPTQGSNPCLLRLLHWLAGS